MIGATSVSTAFPSSRIRVAPELELLEVFLGQAQEFGVVVLECFAGERCEGVAELRARLFQRELALLGRLAFQLQRGGELGILQSQCGDPP